MDVRAYATLAAALARGDRGRAEVLAAHGLDEEAFEALDAEWQEKLSEAVSSAPEDGLPELLVEYHEAYLAAQQGNPVMPFPLFAAAMHVLERGGDPTVELARLGVSLAEVLRAHAHWTKEMIAQPELAERFSRKP